MGFLEKLGLFGKNDTSESQLTQNADDLDKRCAELDRRESILVSSESNIEHEKKLVAEAQARLEADRATFRDVVKKNRDIIAEEKATLDSRQIDIAKLESEAGVMDKAQAMVNETTRQQAANQAESKRLNDLANTLSEERQHLERVKAELFDRERAVAAAEQKRNAGFTDQHANLDRELRDKRAAMESEISAEREEKLSALKNELAEIRGNSLTEVARTENSERDRIRNEIAVEREDWAKLREDERKRLEAERTELEKQKGNMSALQSKLEGCKAEIEANERTLERRGQLLEDQWLKRHEKIDDTVEALFEERRNSMESEMRELKAVNEGLRKEIRNQIELFALFDQLKRQLGNRDAAEVLQDLNDKTEGLKHLREELATRPTEEMRTRYKEMNDELQRRQTRIDELEEREKRDADDVAATQELRRKNRELEAENTSLDKKAKIFEDMANEAQAELSRLRAAYERPSEVGARYKEIEMPHIKADKVTQPDEAEVDEIAWLTGIGEACDRYGLHFNPRILKAFHTALKTAEWSPLTVLAGVSGTGKSELPRLYSHFGGLLFEPLSVQPNWDSQESMLGFFNSIDNKFDAQPVLRFLAQSQLPGNETYEKRLQRWRKMSTIDLRFDPEEDKELIEALKQSDYPGLENAVCLVLLDEMNLAHPELYFAEFLSKLELRRGMKGGEVPFLPVKIGAGKPSYQLPLGRNVLWTGTMNQDETTKSLSDKVLDRSIIIHFPRPTELKRRLKLTALDEKNRGPLLHKKSWRDWLAQGSSFSEDEITPFKKFIEKMNSALAVTGRAIGHRVWQSVEYYMANYPDVRAAKGDKDRLELALHTAFEDQLVQKVMPKLRGIDTAGKSRTECLEKIQTLINTIGVNGKPFNLAQDFELALELGYGQFIWQSANYLNEESVSENSEADAPGEESSDNISQETRENETD